MKRTVKFLSLFIVAAVILAVVQISNMFVLGAEGGPPAGNSAAKSADQRLSDAVVLYVGSSQALVNNSEKQIDPENAQVQPVVKNMRTLVPARFISESLGASVDWDGQTSGITITLGGKKVTLTAGSAAMKAGGSEIKLEVPAEIINDRVFVPLRQLSEALDRKVFYDRGLIIVSNTDNLFDASSEKTLIDEVISKVNRLPGVGSEDKLMSLLEQSQNGNNNSAYHMYNKKEARVSTGSPAPAAQAAAGADEAKAAEQKAKADEPAAEMSTPANAAGNDFSATNVQVRGVDEADIVKTDGEYIYQVNKQRVVIAKAYPAENMKVSGVIDFGDANFTPRELYLEGLRLVVIGSTYNSIPVYGPGSKIMPGPMRRPVYSSRGTVRVIVYDITDRSNIKRLRDIEVEGDYVSSRKIGSTLYFVSNRYVNYYSIKQNGENPLPSYRDSSAGDGFINVDYPEIRYFPGFVEPNYLLVSAFDVNKPDEKANVSAYLGAGQNIYVSEQNMYIALTGTRWVAAEPKADTDASSGRVSIRMPAPAFIENTQLYKFSLDKSRVTYLCRGEAPGTILNQYSMDENGAFFRIATTRGNAWATGENVSKNNIYVFDETLNLSGKIEDIAPGERIYSVRFIGDRAYMVTFKQVDPFFVVDLKDPASPKVLGALKIPGFSDYLHPYDESHIIGFGKDTVELPQKDWKGNVVGTAAYYQGMKIAMFDVSDVANPKQMYVEKIGDRGTESELLHNPKALLFSKSKSLMAFPVTVMEVKDGYGKVDSSSGVPRYGEFTFQGAYVYNVDLSSGFKLKGRITHISDEQYKKAGNAWYDGDRNVERIMYINDVLYTLSKGMIKANGLQDLKEEQSLIIP